MNSAICIVFISYLSNHFINGAGLDVIYDDITNKSDHLNLPLPHRNATGRYSMSLEPIEPRVLVPKIDTYYCDTDRDCSSGFSLTSKMVCQEDHTCGCSDSCLIYSYIVYGLHATFEFHCGECGQLGSECESEKDCEYPGFCSRKDQFCHCPIGEHKDNICIVIDTHFLVSTLIFGFGVFLMTILCGVGYNCLLGYRIYGNWRWWRNTPNWRRRHQAQATMGPAKSPAFTATMNMWNSSAQHGSEISNGPHVDQIPSTSTGIRHASTRSINQSTFNGIGRASSVLSHERGADLDATIRRQREQDGISVIQDDFSYNSTSSYNSVHEDYTYL